MSSVCISVEWLFGDVVSSFVFIDQFKKVLKVALSSVGKMYIVAGILRNSLTCMYGNSALTYFGLSPPTLQDYIH